VGIFAFPLTVSIGSFATPVITGMNGNWTNAANNCTDWTSAMTNYETGDSSSTSSTALSNGTTSCGTSRRLMCVEQ
jgi:hypothetical protein